MSRADRPSRSIRKACAQDEAAILSLIKRFRTDDARQAKRGLDRFFRPDGRTRDEVLVATAEDKVVGVSGYWYDDYADYDIYWLNWTYVEASYRNQGIASRLLRTVFRELRKKKVRKLFVDTSSRDSYGPALRFYLKHGFKIEGVLRDYYDWGEDQIILGKELSQ